MLDFQSGLHQHRHARATAEMAELGSRRADRQRLFTPRHSVRGGQRLQLGPVGAQPLVRIDFQQVDFRGAGSSGGQRRSAANCSASLCDA